MLVPRLNQKKEEDSSGFLQPDGTLYLISFQVRAFHPYKFVKKVPDAGDILY